MKKHFKLTGILLFVLMLMAACSNNKSAESADKNAVTGKQKEVELTISAAASLKDAMDDMQAAYEKEHPNIKLKFNFGSSGSLQQQISQGAPVDLFFSAAEEKFDALVKKGKIRKEDGLDLLGNDLVLIAPKQEKAPIKSFKDLGKAGKISIGMPESVPAGEYAKETLEKMNLWNTVESNIVYAKDVRQVLSYVETGNVDAGIVYKTDALVSSKVKIAATADPKMHGPIIYPVGVIKDSKHYKEAKNFYHYLQSDEALKVFKDYGFTSQ
ncbi:MULTISPECIES: molybdate ABC transporter substrate-binding protein [Bacillaceae]|uniref:molybdate ABC transporter substrate-binding protein n=1 Tax=Bacillaceae TaxID=186817 RepID=UPI000E76AE65|nr:molybdate ABC transporter substrate-binding protein [Bacillus sp. PK3_68]RJS60662.1 molybdate ABC transporter substrate-binding protein [Bacillus sp. PK3_68]